MSEHATTASKTPKAIGTAADHGSFELKQPLDIRLRKAGHHVVDFGDHNLQPNDDYLDFGIPLAHAVAEGKTDRGIAVCGSDVGACVAANKIAGVRACLIHAASSAHQGVDDDNLNMICLGDQFFGVADACELVETFLAASFSGEERHRRRLAKVAALELRRRMRGENVTSGRQARADRAAGRCAEAHHGLLRRRTRSLGGGAAGGLRHLRSPGLLTRAEFQPDAVEIYGAHGYPIDQFFRHPTNRRTDRYGGKTLAERARFSAELIEAVRRAVGPEFPICLRIFRWKLQDYAAKLAATPEEMQSWLKPLVEAGVDLFHCAQRRLWEPEFNGSYLDFAGWAKKLTGKTTVTVGSVGHSGDFLAAFEGEASSPSCLDELLRRPERGDFDLVAVGRALLADPGWAREINE